MNMFVGPKIRRSWLSAFALFLALTLGAASCGDESADLDVDALGAGYLGRASVFNSAEFLESEWKLKDVAEIATQECMRGLGFDYEPGSTYNLEANDPVSAALLQNPSEEQFANEWGFGLVDPEVTGPDAGPDDEGPAAELGPEDEIGLEPIDPSDPDSVAYHQALMGTSDSNPGCQWEAYEDVRRFGQEYGDQFETVLALQTQFAVTQPVADYYLQWSSCMKDRGFSYLSPLHAVTDVQSQLPTYSISFETQREIAIATVDCGGTVIDRLPDELQPEWAQFVSENS